MIVKIFGMESGMEIFHDVVAVRIKDNNLLIFKKYLPIIGTIDGDFSIELLDKRIVKYENVHAFFINNNNIIKIIFGSDHYE